MSFLKEYPQILPVKTLAKKSKVAVYLVGGFCRDYLLSQKTLDFDFAIEQNAITFARRFAREIHGAFVLLDEEHGCARVVKNRPDATAETYDFADFRGPTIKADVRQRDFTINTLAVGLDAVDEQTSLATALLDSEGGVRDLNARRIRAVSARSFTQDPLRLLRAFSLQAELDFKIIPATLRQIRKDRERIATVSYERIRDELFKILATPRAAANIRQMDQVGLLKSFLPQVSVMYRVRQGGYHHLDVWRHTLETLEHFEDVVKEFGNDPNVRTYLEQGVGGDRSRLALIKLAILLHDIGKPQTLRREKGKISFHGHERVGEDAAKVIAELLKLSTHERYALQNMVRWHLRPGYLSNFKSPSVRAVFRYFRDTKEEAAGIALLSIADQRGTRGPMTKKKDLRHHEKICRRLIHEYFVKQTTTPLVRILTGDDLIKTLRLKPSPLFATILREVEEGQAAGQVNNKQDALALGRKIVLRENKKCASKKQK